MTERGPKISWENLRHPFSSKYGPTVYLALGDTVRFTVLKIKETKTSTGLVHREEIISDEILGQVNDFSLQNGRVTKIQITITPNFIDWALLFFSPGHDLKSKTFSSRDISNLSIDTPNPRVPITSIAQLD